MLFKNKLYIFPKKIEFFYLNFVKYNTLIDVFFL